MLLAPHTGENNGPVDLAFIPKLKLPSPKLAAGIYALSAGSLVSGFVREFKYG
jgi:hypothetical protein